MSPFIAYVRVATVGLLSACSGAQIVLGSGLVAALCAVAAIMSGAILAGDFNRLMKEPSP